MTICERTNLNARSACSGQSKGQSELSGLRALSTALRAAVLFWLSGSCAPAAPFSDLHIFGDSFSDTGNIFALTSAFTPSSPQPPPPYFDGRFSDGRVWVETLARRLGQPEASAAAGMPVPAFLNVPGNFLPADGGNNYAIGGARTGTSGSLDAFGVPSGLATQVGYFLDQHPDGVDPDALYVVYAGSNDLRDAAVEQDAATRADRVAAALENLTTVIESLVAAGAKTVLVPNIGDLGTTPEALLVRGNSAESTEVSSAFNLEVASRLSSLAATTGADIIQLDAFSLFEAISQDIDSGGGVYGITNGEMPCFEGFAGSAGADCSISFFSDDLHISAAVHKVLGEKAFTVLPAAPTSVVAAVLPSSRSAMIGAAATAFATLLNAGPQPAQGCRLRPLETLPGDFLYQPTDPVSNAVTGQPNEPFDVAVGGAQTLLIAFTPFAAFDPMDVSFAFGCDNSYPAEMVAGVNTLLLSASETPVPDLVAVATTLSGDGVLRLPQGADTGVFAVASFNAGVSAGLTALADTGGSRLPLALAVCQTDPATSVCLNPSIPTDPSVELTVEAGGTPTLAVFATALDDVPFDPRNNRIFLRFVDADGRVRGATSVAFTTEAE